MTFKEKYIQDYPYAKTHPDGQPYGCPDSVTADECCNLTCSECWNQEIPEETNEIRKETEGMGEKVIVSIEDAIENRLGQIHALEKDIKTLEARKKCDENAHILKMTFDSFVAAGFDEQQAWELLMKLMEGAAKQIK